jgi:hypothetical protein
MQVSLDDGETWEPAPQGVKVIYPDVEIPGQEHPGSLHVKLTTEGIVKDLWVDPKGDGQDYVQATDSQMLDVIISELVEEDL